MVRKSIMIIAGEPSGDLLGAELVGRLRRRLTDADSVPSDDGQPLRTGLEPEFFGAGGPQMAKAGVRLEVDMTQHSVVGLWEVAKRYREFRRIFHRLFQLARHRQPDLIVCIDFAGFNLRFARAIRRHTRSIQGTFGNWTPRVVQYVSPQVWASRPQRAVDLARDFDLLLSIIPFEGQWYADHAPGLRVEFVGHPIVDRHPHRSTSRETISDGSVLLLPGSREGELRRHLPVMLDAMQLVRAARPALRWRMVLPNDRAAALARTFSLPPELEVQVGTLDRALSEAGVAIASTGTVTLECAWFGVPTVALYKTSPFTYAVAKRLIRVKYMAMPNLLAGEEVFPEFIQDAATGPNIARAALQLLDDPNCRARLRPVLERIIHSLGQPGASDRAADLLSQLLQSTRRPMRASLG